MNQTRDEVLGTFMSLTGLDEGVAYSFLDSTNWNLEECLNLYEASSGAPSASDSQRKTSNSKTDKLGSKETNGRSSSKSSSKNIVDLSHEEDHVIDENGEYVRAPLPIKTEILSPNPVGLGIRRRAQPDFDPRAPQTVFEMFRDFRKETQVLEDNVTSDGNKKIQRLGTLFRPPVEIISREEFDAAKASAALAKRWLLVNIQDATEFDSQKLNRDTWSDGELKKIISKNFVFWQRYHDSEDGKRYCRFYRQAEIKPHIGLIDPRTGELIRFWSGFVEPATLKKEKFLQENTLEGYAAVKKPAPKKNLLDCSEEEQLAAVLAESLKETQTNPQASNVIAIEDEDNDNNLNVSNSNHKRKAEKTLTKEQDIKKLKTPEPVKPPLPEKPATETPPPAAAPTPSIPLPMDDGTGDCVVQIRDSNGSTLKRNFNSTDTLQMIHSWVALRRTDKSNFSLVTQFPRRTFSGKDLEQTIQEANLGKRFVLIVEVHS